MLNFLRRLPLISASNYLLVHQKLVPQVPQTIASDTLVLDVVPQGPQTSASSAPDECPKFPKRVPQVPQTSAPSAPNECPKRVPQCPKCVIRWSQIIPPIADFLYPPRGFKEVKPPKNVAPFDFLTPKGADAESGFENATTYLNKGRTK